MVIVFDAVDVLAVAAQSLGDHVPADLALCGAECGAVQLRPICCWSPGRGWATSTCPTTPIGVTPASKRLIQIDIDRALRRAGDHHGPSLVCVRTDHDANLAVPAEMTARFFEVYSGPAKPATV